MLAAGAALAVAACGDSPAARKAGPGDGWKPAERIVTLAPHLAELTFAAGAGERLRGVVAYSDFPPAVGELPLVGDAFRVDLEIIAEIAPDLILAWASGNPAPLRERLEKLGYRVVALEAGTLGDIAGHLRIIGRLAGTSAVAEIAASKYEARLAELRRRYSTAERIRVFYQVAAAPLMTVSRRHVIGQAIELCGGSNPYAALPALTPVISTESVIDAAPEAIIASIRARSAAGHEADVLSGWREWTSLPAVRAGSLYTVDADLMSRPATRLLDGVEQLCERLAQARQRDPED